jgi:hypothetical protein
MSDSIIFILLFGLIVDLYMMPKITKLIVGLFYLV